MIQMQAVFSADIEKHLSAGGIECLFPVVHLARFLVWIRQFKPQGFQRFFLLRFTVIIIMLRIESPLDLLKALEGAVIKAVAIREKYPQNRKTTACIHDGSDSRIILEYSELDFCCQFVVID